MYTFPYEDGRGFHEINPPIVKDLYLNDVLQWHFVPPGNSPRSLALVIVKYVVMGILVDGGPEKSS